MRKSREIKKLIDKVIFNEQVNLASQDLPKRELKANIAYAENPKLYEEIKTAFEKDGELKQRIEKQVEKNKQDLAEKLSPDKSLPIDNILMLNALKKMEEDCLRKESTEDYMQSMEKIVTSLVELNHLVYISRMQEFLEEYGGDTNFAPSEFKANGRKEIYKAIEIIYKSGHKNILNDKMKNAQEKYLDRLKRGLREIGDIDNYQAVKELVENDKINNKNEYVDVLVKLNLDYEIPEQAKSKMDRRFIDYANELSGKETGKNANTYSGYTNALIEKKTSVFQRIANKIKSMFRRKDVEVAEFSDGEPQYDARDKKRSHIS